MDHAQIKERERTSWSNVAPGWNKYDAILSQGAAVVTERMLDAVRIAPGQRVLDVACGTGEPAIPAARRVGPTGRVIATDLSEPMIAFAKHKAAAQGVANVEFRVVDGEEVDVGDGFDAVTMRWGLMFMPDPDACLRRLHSALRVGGRIALTCWTAPDRNPFVSTALAAIRKHVELPAPPPGAPGLFAFADPERLRSCLAGAGFREVVVEPVELCFAVFDTGVEAFTMIRELAGPVAAILAQQPADTRAAIERDAVAGYEALRADGRVALRGVTWLAHATK